MSIAPSTRLAMVACRGPHEGPWLRGRGNEKAIRVSFLADGETVEAHLENHDGSLTTSHMDKNGDYKINPFRRVRFIKHGSTSPTTVELVIR